MFTIPILLGSTRRNRESLKVARFVHRRTSERLNVRTELIDLLKLEIPMMEERIRFRDDSPPAATVLGRKISDSDSIMIVTPEYNNGYPGVLKNALDYLLPEYKRKPFGIVTVSNGKFGGLNCLAQLRLVSLGMGAFPVPARFPVSKVQDSFDDDGNPLLPELEKQFTRFLDEFLWFTEAIVDRKKKEPIANAA
jgi:NAD(P)H-dependent FMN reductase